MAEFVDLKVETRNPKALDATIQQMGPAAVIDGSFDGQTCTVRCFGGCHGFIKFAIEHQGYGKISA